MNTDKTQLTCFQSAHHERAKLKRTRVQPPLPPPRWKILLAFAIIYLVWGSTFLAIRIGVREVPPLLLAAMRFLIAGLALFGWRIASGDPFPARRQWISAFLLATLIFLIDYGLLFWSEQRVPSGSAAVIMGTIPAFMAVSETLMLGTIRITFRLAAALLVGIAGVAILSLNSLRLGGATVDKTGAAALVIASICVAIATPLMRKLPLPESKALSSGTQMLAGGILLTMAAAAFGEFRDFHPSAVSSEAWIALLYLTIAGSIVAFTAYTWLIHHESPTKVGTYAYVNPVVAVILGHFAAGEELGLRTILGTVCVLGSVVGITTLRVKRR